MHLVPNSLVHSWIWSISIENHRMDIGIYHESYIGFFLSLDQYVGHLPVDHVLQLVLLCDHIHLLLGNLGFLLKYRKESNLTSLFCFYFSFILVLYRSNALKNLSSFYTEISNSSKCQVFDSLPNNFGFIALVIIL